MTGSRLPYYPSQVTAKQSCNRLLPYQPATNTLLGNIADLKRLIMKEGKLLSVTAEQSCNRLEITISPCNKHVTWQKYRFEETDNEGRQTAVYDS